MIRTPRLAHWVLTAAVLLAACETPSAPSATTLTVRGAASSPVAASAVLAASPSPLDSVTVLTGAPSSITIRMYALWISQQADCSAPELVQTYGTVGQDKDFVENPVLFSGTPADGTYPCVMFQMSDVLRMKPATSFGACVAGMEYSGDIYRDGESDWKNVDLNPIVGHGTDAAPLDDHVTIFFARDTAAVLARGVSTHQLVPLGSDLIVPGQSTFYMDAHEAVQTDGTNCGLEPPHVSFQ
jgi:hypothetical protein